MRNILNIRQLRNMFAAAMFSVLALCFCNRISAIELNENSAESNIAPNSSFEIQKGGSAVPDNWTFWNDGDSKAVLSNESPHSGKNCVKLTSKQKAMTRVFSRVIKVTAGQPYVFSAYLKGQPGGWGLSVVFENEKAEYLGGTPMHYVKVTGKWKKFEMKFVPESGFVKLFIQGNSASDNDCSIWVDDINFVKFDKNQKLNMERERELKKKEDIVTKITQQKLELLKIKQAIRAASTHGFVSLIAKNSLEAAESTLKTAAQQLSEEKNFDQVYELIYKTDCSLAKAKGFLTAVKFPRWAKQVIFNYLNVQENVITKGLTKERFQEEIAATPSYAKGFLFYWWSPFGFHEPILDETAQLIDDCRNRGIRAVGFNDSSLLAAAYPLFPHSEEWAYRKSDGRAALNYGDVREMAHHNSGWQNHIIGQMQFSARLGFDGLFFDDFEQPSGSKEVDGDRALTELLKKASSGVREINPEIVFCATRFAGPILSEQFFENVCFLMEYSINKKDPLEIQWQDYHNKLRSFTETLYGIPLWEVTYGTPDSEFWKNCYFATAVIDKASRYFKNFPSAQYASFVQRFADYTYGDYVDVNVPQDIVQSAPFGNRETVIKDDHYSESRLPFIPAISYHSYRDQAVKTLYIPSLDKVQSAIIRIAAANHGPATANACVNVTVNSDSYTIPWRQIANLESNGNRLAWIEAPIKLSSLHSGKNEICITNNNGGDSSYLYIGIDRNCNLHRSASMKVGVKDYDNLTCQENLGWSGEYLIRVVLNPAAKELGPSSKKSIKSIVNKRVLNSGKTELVVHLLNLKENEERKNLPVEVDVSKIKLPNNRRVTLLSPDTGEVSNLPFTMDKKIVRFTIPKLKAWSMVVIGGPLFPKVELSARNRNVIQGEKCRIAMTVENLCPSQMKGSIRMLIPEKWTGNIETRDVNLAIGEKKVFEFDVQIPKGAPMGRYAITPVFKQDDDEIPAFPLQIVVGNPVEFSLTQCWVDNSKTVKRLKLKVKNNYNTAISGTLLIKPPKASGISISRNNCDLTIAPGKTENVLFECKVADLKLKYPWETRDVSIKCDFNSKKGIFSGNVQLRVFPPKVHVVYCSLQSNVRASNKKFDNLISVLGFQYPGTTVEGNKSLSEAVKRADALSREEKNVVLWIRSFKAGESLSKYLPDISTLVTEKGIGLILQENIQDADKEMLSLSDICPVVFDKATKNKLQQTIIFNNPLLGNPELEKFKFFGEFSSQQIRRKAWGRVIANWGDGSSAVIASNDKRRKVIYIGTYMDAMAKEWKGGYMYAKPQGNINPWWYLTPIYNTMIRWAGITE